MLTSFINKRVLGTNLRQFSVLTVIKNHVLSNNLHCCTESQIPCGMRNNPSTLYRKYSDESKTQPKTRLAPLIDVPCYVGPRLLQIIYNFFYIQFKVASIDKEFSIHEFTEGTKHAVSVVSKALSVEDYESLEDLVSHQVIQVLKPKIERLNSEQKKLIATEKEDIFVHFPYEIKFIPTENKDDEGHLEVMTVHHYLKGVEQLSREKQSNPLFVLPPEARDDIMIANYRFIRKYVNGIGEPWMINLVNHFSITEAF